MRKAIIEMPNSCADCPCNDDEYSVCRLDKNYMSNARFVFNREKPEWCPLDSKKNKAIPSEWIEKQMAEREDYGDFNTAGAIGYLLLSWEKENEVG